MFTRPAMRLEILVVTLAAAVAAAPAMAQEGGSDPALLGQWLPPQAWPVTAIHAALLPNGKVMHYSYPNGGPNSVALVWDPVTNIFTGTTVNSDLFCSGLSFLADGRLFVAGGNDYACHFQGRFDTHTFDPASQTWSPQQDMATARWYPTNVTLGNGWVAIFSGLNDVCENTPLVEIHRPGIGNITLDTQAFLPLFPRMHLLSSGLVTFVGPQPETYVFNPFSASWFYVAQSNFKFWRAEGTSVLVPGQTDQVMIIGGENETVGHLNTCEIIDFTQPQPQWQLTGSLNFARAHGNAVILPDKTIMLVGGGTLGSYEQPILEPELYNPDAGTWTVLPPHVYGRMYHSTALLLPDGRVLAAGQDDGPSAVSGEIYEPAYLHRGPRPQIDAAPGQIGYNLPLTITTPQAADITSVVLISLSAMTHSTNPGQRLVDLPFQVSAANKITALGPPSGNHAPPGYYMMFILDELEIPSAAAMVHLLPAATGDLNGDGMVNIEDLLLVLSVYGPCPAPPAPCVGDTNGDGVVNVVDLLTVLGNWT